MLHLTYTHWNTAHGDGTRTRRPPGIAGSRCPGRVWFPRGELTCGCVCVDRDCNEAAGLCGRLPGGVQGPADRRARAADVVTGRRKILTTEEQFVVESQNGGVVSIGVEF